MSAHANSTSKLRACPRCGVYHDDVADNGNRYALCGRCMDEIIDLSEDEYDYAADDFTFRAARER
jgi:ribosomal protein S27AE